MYFRFVVPVRLDDVRADAGLFHRAYWVRNNIGADCWIGRELCRELAWFNRNLAVPGRFRFRKSRPMPGLCWFRPEAGEHIVRARYVAYLLEEAEMPVIELRRDAPGHIIWKDDHQIVARPDRSVPRVFSGAER